MTLSLAQQEELAKYPVAYQAPNYRMSRDRASAVERTLEELPWRQSYLDVSCGRGEMLRFADSLGFAHVEGTEIVDDLVGDRVTRALAWDLPFGDASFQVVSLLDVIEHLLPGDDERACREIARVAQRAVILTANNLASMHQGVELHCNKRPYEVWHELFGQWFEGWTVNWLKGRVAKRSEQWLITIA